MIIIYVINYFISYNIHKSAFSVYLFNLSCLNIVQISIPYLLLLSYIKYIILKTKTLVPHTHI